MKVTGVSKGVDVITVEVPIVCP